MRHLPFILATFTMFAWASTAAAVDASDTLTKQCANADKALDNYSQGQACNALLKANPDNAEALTARGGVYLAVGEYASAIIDLTRAIGMKPQSADLMFLRGETFRRMGRFDDAMIDLTKAIDLDPKSARAYASRGAIFNERGYFIPARTDLDTALALDPRHAPVHEHLMLLGLKTGNFRLSIESADALVDLDPQSAYFQNMKCWTRVGANQSLDIARKACDLAIEMGGGAHALQSRGLLNLKERKFAAALADYDAALAVKGHENSADSLLGRGLALRGLKRKAEARESIDAAKRKDPGITDMFRRYGYSV
jgi:tetratricopeptide (TPR) repeat protein